MPKLPPPLADAITASLQQIMPDGLVLSVSPLGRSLWHDSHNGSGGGSAFTSILLLVSRRAGLRDAVDTTMTTAALAASSYTGAPWPPGRVVPPRHRTPRQARTDALIPPLDDINTHITTTDGQLHMSYTSHGQTILKCPPVDLPPGWPST